MTKKIDLAIVVDINAIDNFNSGHQRSRAEGRFRGDEHRPQSNKVACFIASMVINRHGFGLNWNKALETGGVVVSEDVDIAWVSKVMQIT
jgi:hypothetical protein